MQIKLGNPPWTRVGVGPWTGIDWRGTWIETYPLDPYLVWADATNQADFATANGEYTPMLIEFVDPVNGPSKFLEFLKKAFQIDSVGDFDEFIWPKIYQSGGTPIKARYVNILVKTGKFFALFPNASKDDDEIWNSVIRRFQLALPISAVPSTLPESTEMGAEQQQASGAMAAGQPKKLVVLGIIDDGLAFANRAVRDRIAFFWDQDQDAANSGRQPDGFNYGTEYGPIAGPPAQDNWIAKWLAQTGPGGLDEESVYSKAHLMQLRRRITHGAAVMEVATRDLDNAKIICVQLPSHTTQDTSGSSLGSYVMDALQYILVRTRDLAKDQTTSSQTPDAIPIVVNLSYGDFAGPHDARSLLESGIDDFVLQCKSLVPSQTVGVVIPAGNSNLARCHAEFVLDRNPIEKELLWRIHPDDKTPSFMEMWLPPGNDGVTISVEVIPPGESRGQSVTRGSAYVWPTVNSPTCTVVFPAIPANSTSFDTQGQPVVPRRMILIAIAPTASLDPRTLAPAGVWKVIVRSSVAIAQAIDAWIQRDDSPYGYPRRGRQSYFEDSNYVRFNRDGMPCEFDGDTAPPFEGDHSKAYVKRTGTMNGIATGLSTIVPSGYGKANRKAARYSSSGRASGVPIRSPLMAQVSDDSDAHHGVLAGGTHSGTLAGFGGTSIAAPQVANQLARILSTPRFVAAQLKQFVGQNGAVTVQLSGRSGQTPPGGATQVGPIDVLPPQTSQDERLGYGTIDPPPPDRRGIEKI